MPLKPGTDTNRIIDIFNKFLKKQMHGVDIATPEYKTGVGYLKEQIEFKKEKELRSIERDKIKEELNTSRTLMIIVGSAFFIGWYSFVQNENSYVLFGMLLSGIAFLVLLWGHTKIKTKLS